MNLTVKTSAFSPGGEIPKKFSCEGADLSPALSWSGSPAGTKEFALICDDPDAPSGTFTHWVIWGIPADRQELPEGVPRDRSVASLGGARQGRNDFGAVGYRGPCPPPGTPHRYFFRIYALDASPGLSPGASAAELQAAMKGHIAAQGELMGKFAR